MGEEEYKKKKLSEYMYLWKDYDLELIDDEQERTLIIEDKVKKLNRKYIAKAIVAEKLKEHLKLSEDFYRLNEGNYIYIIKKIENYLDIIVRNKVKEQEQEEEKSERLNSESDRETASLIESEEVNKSDIDLEEVATNSQISKHLSCSETVALYTTKVVKRFLPFSLDITFLESHFNSTIILLFEIIRFFILLSVIGFILFFYFLVYHLAVFKDNTDVNFGKRTKYGIPWFFVYSSFKEDEYKNYSVTYGIWLIFYFFSSMVFYYIWQSNRSRTHIFHKTNKCSYLSTYFFTSWDFNIVSELKSHNKKRKIMLALEDYFKYYGNKNLEQKKVVKEGKGKVEEVEEEEEVEEKEAPSCNVCLVILSYFVFLVSLIGCFFLDLIILLIRKPMLKKLDEKGRMGVSNFFADMLPLIIYVVWLLIYSPLISILTKCKFWHNQKKYALSLHFKRTIGFIWNIGVYLFVQIWCGLKNKDISDMFMKMKSFKDIFTYEHTPSETGEIGDWSMTKCKEDEVGINLLFFTTFYIAFSYLKDFFYLCFGGYFSNDTKIAKYYPLNVLTHIFIEVILFSITAYFIPFIFVLFPFVMVIEFKFQYIQIKNFYNIDYDDVTIEERSNQKSVLLIFFVMTLINMIGCLFFYIEPFDHRYDCGPFGRDEKMSDYFYNSINDNAFFGWFYRILSNPTMLILLLGIFICIAIFKDNGPGEKYYNFIIERQRKLLSNFHLAYESLEKRDVITSVLLRISRKKQR